ncbi:MAG: sigma-70 family RNA polymerase sigma factor [Phycisphaerae bacterium]|nr:sigma-70 family RNA polymerase sigma factor [Phycisphaerae bacterium]
MDKTSEPNNLVGRLLDQDKAALADLFAVHRDRLWRMVNFRIDRRLRSRLWPDDVLQEAYLAAQKRIHRFSEDGFSSPFVWLRLIVHQTMIDLHRQYLDTQKRDIDREISLDNKRFTQTTATFMVLQLMGNWTTPTQAVVRQERLEVVEQAITGLEPLDREVLALRHFEELTNAEVAEELGIQGKAASIRYVRALKRLKNVLSQSPGIQDHE